MDKPEQIKAWQKRLEDTFSYNEIVGGRYLLHTMDTEKAVGNHFIKKYHGHRILTDSFLDFCGETIDTQVAFNNQHGWPQGQPYYATCLLMYVTMFRTVRSAELLSANGYPLQGYAVFRGLKDQVFVLCAVANGLATFSELFGYEGLPATTWTEKDQMKAVYNRVEAEREIREKIFGKKSGLKHETQVELVRWERLFNMEVHRSLLPLFRASHRLLAEKNVGVKLGPNQDELAESMYLNRATETNWMILRLLPFLRRPETPVSEDWSRKWGILDDSFRFMTQGLADIGKKIAPATTISNTPFVARPDVLVNTKIRENLFRVGVNYAFFTGSVGCRPHDC